MKVLIISGHPHLDRSIANISILNEFKKLPDVTIRDIGGLYPDYNINVAEEQKFLLEADVIVWQFPVYWYGMPSIMKKWQEDVLSHGFAYGSTAKLKGKKLIVSVTTGSPEDSYQPGAAQNYTIDTLLTPLHQCAAMCGLKYAGTFHLGGMIYIPGITTDEEINAMKLKAGKHAAKVIGAVNSL